MKIHKTNALVSVFACLFLICLYNKRYLVNFSVQKELGIFKVQLNTVYENNVREKTAGDSHIIESRIDDGEISLNRQKHFLIIVIPSKPEQIEYRNELRTRSLNMSIWSSHEFEDIEKQYLDFKLMFVIGKYQNADYTDELMEEASNNDDMHLVQDLAESRSVIRDKVLWGMRKSVEMYDYSFFVKIDHETLVDLPRLVHGIQSIRKENVYAGNCGQTFKNGEHYFKYCLSGAYILSVDIVEKISALTEEEIEYDEELKNEGIFTGWLVQKVREKHKIPVIPKVAVKKGEYIVDIYDHGVKLGYYRFRGWFYHWPSLGNLEMFKNMFECRIRSNIHLCPSMIYSYQYLESCKCNRTSMN